jgi:hypothetical protein
MISTDESWAHGAGGLFVCGVKKLCWWDTNKGVIAEILMMRSIIKNEYPKLVVMSIANP